MSLLEQHPELEVVARIAHEVNRAYCQATGDEALPWEEAPDWQKETVLAGVIGILNGSITGPGESHQSWIEKKIEDGWTFGLVKDPEKKRHPCMVPFKELAFAQQVKDHLFFGTVTAILRLSETWVRGIDE